MKTALILIYTEDFFYYEKKNFYIKKSNSFLYFNSLNLDYTYIIDNLSYSTFKSFIHDYTINNDILPNRILNLLIKTIYSNNIYLKSKSEFDIKHFILNKKLSLENDTVSLLLKNNIIKFIETSVHNRRNLIVCKTALECNFNNFKYIPSEIQKNDEILDLYKSEFFRQSIKKYNIKNPKFNENPSF